jgi:hypothetical protein
MRNYWLAPHSTVLSGNLTVPQPANKVILRVQHNLNISMSLYASFHHAYNLKCNSKMNASSFNARILPQDCKGFTPCDTTAQYQNASFKPLSPSFNNSLNFDLFYNHLFRKNSNIYFLFTSRFLRENLATEGETCFVTVFMKPTPKNGSITLKLNPHSFINFPRRK